MYTGNLGLDLMLKALSSLQNFYLMNFYDNVKSNIFLKSCKFMC